MKINQTNRFHPILIEHFYRGQLSIIKRVFPFELRFRKNQQHKKKHPKDVYYTPPFALPYGSIAAW